METKKISRVDKSMIAVFAVAAIMLALMAGQAYFQWLAKNYRPIETCVSIEAKFAYPKEAYAEAVRQWHAGNFALDRGGLKGPCDSLRRKADNYPPT